MKDLHELQLLDPEEAHVRREDPSVTAIGDDDLDLAVPVANQLRDDAELEQELLNVVGELRAGIDA